MSAARTRPERTYRMKELCELTGLTRQAIHFYVQQGLLPPGTKTGRNMAYYTDAHLERLELIKKLQHERFLPLKAIRAILDDETAGFEPDQRQLLREVKSRLAGSPLSRPAVSHSLDAAAVCERNGVELSELRRMAELGLLSLADDDAGVRMSADDEWLVEHWSKVRAAGFTSELGFGVEELAVYEQAVTDLFAHEKALLIDRMTTLPPDRVARMVEDVLPLIHQLIARFHTAAVRNFFAAME